MFDGRTTPRYNLRRDWLPENFYEHRMAHRHTQHRREFDPPDMRWRLFSGKRWPHTAVIKTRAHRSTTRPACEQHVGLFILQIERLGDQEIFGAPNLSIS